MKPPRLPSVLFGLLIAVTICAATISCNTGAATRSAQVPSTANSNPPPQALSPEQQTSLLEIVMAGKIPELRWPDFTDYIKHVQKFYALYGNSLPWVRDLQPTPQARQIIATLRNANQLGLNPEDYDASRWDDRLAKLKPATAQPAIADAIRFDADLTVCVMRYVSDLHIGKVNPKHFDFGLDVETKKYDLPQFLKEHVVDGADVTAALAQVEPPYPGYQRTVKVLQTYLALAKQPAPAPLPTVAKAVTPGQNYPGAAVLTQRLRLTGDLPADATVSADSTAYDGPLVDAVKNFQRRHGRTADGRITAQTVADLNVPVSTRVRQLQLTLERWRWLPVGLHSAPIVANIPEFRVRAYDENFKVALSMNVVVGKAYRHTTPVFQDNMAYVVFRPYWSVPYSIAKTEILPKLAKDPNYLSAKNFQVVDSRQEVVGSGPVNADMLAQLRAGKLFIREAPGPKNSLGLAKFIFPNNYNVYMHDSPEHELFAQSRRDFSHGCIRLERPADMAVWVLRNSPGWDAERIHGAMNGSTTQQVNLEHPIPVLIVYATAVAPEDGLIYFLDDIYGYDAELEKILAQGYPYPG